MLILFSYFINFESDNAITKGVWENTVCDSVVVFNVVELRYLNSYAHY